MHSKNTYVIWDASSYFSVKMTEIYVISTLNFKWCILFEMFYVIITYLFLLCVALIRMALHFINYSIVKNIVNGEKYIDKDVCDRQ